MASHAAPRPPELLSVRQAAAILTLSKAAVYNLCKAKKLPHFRLGEDEGTIRIDRADVEKYLEQCRVQRQVNPEVVEATSRRRRLPRGRAPTHAERLGVRCLGDYLPKELRMAGEG